MPEDRPRVMIDVTIKFDCEKCDRKGPVCPYVNKRCGKNTAPIGVIYSVKEEPCPSQEPK